MDFVYVILGFIFLAPPAVLAAFWWLSVRPGGRRAKGLPDTDAVIMARLGGLVCTMLPIVQLFSRLILYRTGALGHYLWFVVPGGGLLLALVVVAGLLSYARGYERPVSSAMVLLSVSTLLLLTWIGING